MDDILEVLKCPICYNNYSKVYFPYLLSCGHSVCSECFSSIKRESNEDLDYYESDDNEGNDSVIHDNISLVSKTSLESERDDESVSLNDNNAYNDNDNSHDWEEESSNSSDNRNRKYDDDDDNNSYDDCNDSNNDDSDDDGDDGNNSDNNYDDNQSDISNTPPNLIIPIEQANEKIKQMDMSIKFKFKCPFCLKKKKITQRDVIVNQSIINFIQSNTNTLADSNQIYCKQCKSIDLSLSHSVLHKESIEDLSEESFDSFKHFYQSLSQSSTKSCIELQDDSKNSLNKLDSNLNHFLLSFMSRIYSDNSLQQKVIQTIYNMHIKVAYIPYLLWKGNKTIQNLIKVLIMLISSDHEDKDKEKKNKGNGLIKDKSNQIDQIAKYHQKANELFNHMKHLVFNHKLGNNNEIASSRIIDTILKYYENNVYDILTKGYNHSIYSNLFYNEKCFSVTYNKQKKKMNYNDATIGNYNKVIHFARKDSPSQSFLLNKEGTIIYFLGQNKAASDQFYQYDIPSAKEAQLPNVPIHFYLFDWIIFKQYIFIIGGLITKSTLTDKCYVYSIKNNKWDTFPTLKVKKKKKAIAIVNNRLYSFGGKGIEISMSYIFEYIDLKESNEGGVLACQGEWVAFKVTDYYEPLYKIQYCFLSKYTLVIIGGENRTTEEDEKKGYVIDLEEKKLKETFMMSNSTYNLNGRNDCYRGRVYDIGLGNYEEDFDVWGQLNKIHYIIP